MARFRNLFSILALALLIVFSARGRGQDVGSGVVVADFAPPAIDSGILARVSRSPDSPESQMREAIRASHSPLERVGGGGAHYIAGKVIVKFRAGTSSTSRVSAMSVAGATTSEQPSYANFEIVHIDPSADAEEAARALAARPDVEYAQAAYRVHTEFVPNDPDYGKQWNLPDIDLERAWDIQPAAGSDIIVAVVDTGVAYTNVTMRYHASAFRLNGVTYPSLGDLTLTYVVASDIGQSSRFVAPRIFICVGV